MKQEIIEIIKNNTKNKLYKKNTISQISEMLEIPKSNLLNYIQLLLDEKTIIKVVSKQIYFIDKETFEKEYNVEIKESLIKDIDLFISNLKKEPQDFEKLIGWDKSLSSLVEKCKATISYPPYGLPVVLHGQTGTGKSLIAELSYEYARNNNLLQKDKKFVAVNCSEYANNPELLTANLFGYVKGAFTGAERDTPGLIELADGGVLFLDEVHNLKGECQEKLFQFMDHSTYHRVGDNKTWYTSKIRIIFATTENPKQVLLKTLLRRIPMTIEVPNLESRGLQEKIQIMHHIFNIEQKRLNIRIKMSSQVYNLLISHKYIGNIGGLKSTIQSCCINSLFQVSNNEMEITLHNVPKIILEQAKVEKIVKNHTENYIYVDDLLNMTNVNNRSIRLCDEIINDYSSCVINKNIDILSEKTSKRIVKYLDDIISESRNDNAVDFYIDGICHILQIISKQYHIELSNNNMLSISHLFLKFMEEAHLISNWSLENNDKVNDIIGFLKNGNIRQYNIALEIFKYLENYLDMKLSDIELAILILFLNSFDFSNKVNSRSAVILAHGFSTASSIATAANQFLDKYVFDSIDMPLNVETNMIIKQLNSYISRLDKIEELILLVDMGSLEEIYKGLNIKNINVGIINQVTTSMALEVGYGIIKNESMEKIFEKITSNGQIKYRIENHREKKPMILCSCMSGLGVAERLKDVILHSLPIDSKIEVESYNYNDLLSKGMIGTFFDCCRVVCVVGTVNPHINGLNFIAIEDLVVNNENKEFDEFFRDCMSSNDLELFKKNIVKNFSLSNIMNTLTILNPTKLLEHVTDALENLQERMDIQLSSKICLGLYMHVSCLIERLVLHQNIEIYDGIEKFEKEHKEFINYVKLSFKYIEDYYRVTIPVEEIGYIYDYISAKEADEMDTFD